MEHEVTEILTKSKSEVDAEYSKYPATKPDGFAVFHESTIAPIVYEIPYGSKVLDVGCNDGALMELLKDKRDCEVYGIDLSETAIAKATEKGLQAIIGDAEKIPFDDNSFDVVLCVETLTHIYGIEKALKEMRRVLRPGGILLGCVPHKNMQAHVWNDARLYRRQFDEKELRDMIEPQFPMCHLRILTGAQFAIAWASSFMQDKPAEMLFKAGGNNTDKWESEIQKETKTRVWFGPTQLGGTVYYRMLGFAEKMDKLGLIQAAYERGPMAQIDEKSRYWQQALATKINCGTHCAEGFHIGNRVVMNQMEQILRIADASVWQIVNSRYVLAFLRCAKDLANGPWFRASGKKKYFITDIDDNIFDIPAYNIASHPYHPNSEMEWVAFEQIKLSDAVICSTQFLLDKMQAMFPDKKAHLIPNSIDFDVWDNLKPQEFLKKEAGQIRIGYTGCSNHRADLEMIKEPLSAILKEFSHVQFIFTPQPQPGGLFTGWDGVPNMGLAAKWAPIDEYPHYVAGWDLDVGIAPLRDNDFNRAKSNLRWLEYSAMKIPTVASRVYPFKNSIRNNEDGFICNTKQEWYDALKSLVIDAGRRAQVGRSAYDRVKKDFNMETTAKRYAAVLEEIKNDQNRTPG